MSELLHAAPAPVISAHGLGKRYPGEGQRWALRDVSFEVGAGAALGVVGENGSGKSTLLDLLMGVTQPTEGRLRVHARTASLLELGAGFFVELTGRQNAVQAGLLAGLAATAAAMADDAGRFAELDEFFDRPVRTYSAGMSMRLGFAVAVALAAPVLIVDEVLAVGDGYFQRKCIDRLLELRRKGTTLVLASHDLHAVKSLCDQAIWLHHGLVEAVGAADDVVGRYEEHLRRRSAKGQELPAGRRGTGEITILDVHLKDASGVERTEFRSGDTLRVEALFETRKPVESPVMGVAIFRQDGVYCFGPNSRSDGRLAGRYAGRYLLTAEFPELALLAGSYEVSVAFYDCDHVYAYAWDHRLYSFRVVTDRPDHGLVHLAHHFSVRPVEAPGGPNE